MSIHLTDKAVVRGYAVKEELMIQKGKLLQPHQRINSFLDAQKKLLLDTKHGFEDIIKIAKDMKAAQADPLTDARLLLFASGGPGDFGVALTSSAAALYMLLYKPSYDHSSHLKA